MKASIDMLTPDWRAVSRSFRTAGYLLLLALVALTLVAEGSQPLHTHEGDTAGLYNTDCPLTELAAFDDASPLPPSSSSPWIPLATGAPVATPSDRPQPSPARSSDSRAPPAPLS